MPPTRRGGRGGRRQGQPGKTYQNRSDLNQAPRAVPGQTYGQAGAQIAAQRAVPLPNAQAQMAPGSAPSTTVPAPVPLDAPTTRPGEPVTAGIAMGPGAGPEAVLAGPNATAGGLDPLDEMRALFAAYPSDDLRRVISYLSGP